MKRVAVIGAGLGGLSAAARLAHDGFRVSVFEKNTFVGGKAAGLQIDGLKLDLGPTLLTLPHVVRETFASINAEDLLPRLIEIEKQCSYTMSDGSHFDVYKDIEKTCDSVRFLGESEVNGVRSFYRDAERVYEAAGVPYLEAPFDNATSFLWRLARKDILKFFFGAQLRSLHSLACQHFKSDAMRMWVGRFATYVGASPFQASAAFALIPHIERAFGVHHVEGGIAALSKALTQAAERLGVKFHLGTDARWKLHKNELVAGPTGSESSFDAVVVNRDPLIELGRQDQARALSGYVLLAATEQRVNLPHHSVFFSSDYQSEFEQLFSQQTPQKPTLYICHAAASDSTMAVANQSGVFMMVNAPPLTNQDWRATSARLREFCLKQLLGACSHLKRHEIRVLAERTPVDFKKLGAPRGSIYGYLPHGRFGAFGRPAMQSKTRGVFYAGGGTHPGGGVPMVMLSGRFAAQLARSHLGARA